MSQKKKLIVDEHIELDADADAVWQALTDASELTQWYPLEAVVEPGVGGSISFGWGEEYPPMPAEIITWKPGEQLRLKFDFGLDEPLITDFTIEGDRGKTIVRVVQSGFTDVEGWEDWYEATRAGWQFQMQALAYYLTRQRGNERLPLWIRRPALESDSATWQKLRETFSFGVDHRPGEKYSFSPADILSEGTVLINDGVRQFVATFGDTGILRVSIDPHPTGRSANAFFAFYKSVNTSAEHIHTALENVFQENFG